MNKKETVSLFVVVDRIHYHYSGGAVYKVKLIKQFEQGTRNQSEDEESNCCLGTPLCLHVRDIPLPPYPLEGPISRSLVQVGRQQLCLIETGMNESSLHTEYLSATTFIVPPKEKVVDFETLSSYVFPLNIKGHDRFCVNFCFTAEYQDNEPEEKDCPVRQEKPKLMVETASQRAL